MARKDDPLELQYDLKVVNEGRAQYLAEQKAARKKKRWSIFGRKNKDADAGPAAKEGGKPKPVSEKDKVEKLVRACRQNQIKSAKKQLELGADINGKAKKDGHTALYAAVSADKPNVKLVQFLLKSGANPNCSVYDNETKMYFPVVFQAAHDGSLTIVEMLVLAGASLDPVKDSDGKEKSALQYAIRSGHIDVVKYILHNGRHSQNILDRCLYSAVGKDQPSIVRLLCEAKANVNERTEKASKGTPLLAACRTGYAQVIPILLEFGADVDLGSLPNIGNPNGVTPIEAAQKRQFDHIVAGLEQHKSMGSKAGGKAPKPKKAAPPPQMPGYGPAVLKKEHEDSYYSDYSDYSSYDDDGAQPSGKAPSGKPAGGKKASAPKAPPPAKAKAPPPAKAKAPPPSGKPAAGNDDDYYSYSDQ